MCWTFCMLYHAMFTKLHACYIFNSVNLEFQSNIFLCVNVHLINFKCLLIPIYLFYCIPDVLNQFFVYHKQMPHFLLLLYFVYRTNITSKRWTWQSWKQKQYGWKLKHTPPPPPPPHTHHLVTSLSIFLIKYSLYCLSVVWFCVTL